jgi:hypothetical protein
MDIPAIRENLNVITSLTQPGYPINSMGAALLLRNPLDEDVTVYLKDSADGTTFTNLSFYKTDGIATSLVLKAKSYATVLFSTAKEYFQITESSGKGIWVMQCQFNPQRRINAEEAY